MADYNKMYLLLFNAITDALEKSRAKITATQKNCLSPPSRKRKKFTSQQRTEQGAALSTASEAMPRRQKCGVDNPKRRGKAPPFWSLGVQGRDRNAPAVLLGVSMGAFSHVRERPRCPVQRQRRCLFPPQRCGEKQSAYCSSKNRAIFSIAIEAFLIGNIWNTCHIPSLTCRRQGTFARFIA